MLRGFPPIVAGTEAKVGEFARSNQHTDIPTSLKLASFLFHLLLPSNPRRDIPVSGIITDATSRLTEVQAGLRVLSSHGASTV
jgi:hypothetical protein